MKEAKLEAWNGLILLVKNILVNKAKNYKEHTQYKHNDYFSIKNELTTFKKFK